MFYKIPITPELKEQYDRLQPGAQAVLIGALEWWEAAQNALPEYHTPTTPIRNRDRALIIELWGLLKEQAEHAARLERENERLQDELDRRDDDALDRLTLDGD